MSLAKRKGQERGSTPRPATWAAGHCCGSPRCGKPEKGRGGTKSPAGNCGLRQRAEPNRGQGGSWGTNSSAPLFVLLPVSCRHLPGATPEREPESRRHRACSLDMAAGEPGGGGWGVDEGERRLLNVSPRCSTLLRRRWHRWGCVLPSAACGVRVHPTSSTQPCRITT